ncbi:MAG: HEAT repeat domain-containing protein [Planctomycetia bacterium]|nr:HEAT repeat domain-containing protein [Planctomycetia bacterium]
MQKLQKLLYSILLITISLSGILGCAAISEKVALEKVHLKTAIELRRKMDEWSEQLHSNDPTIRSSAAVSLLGLNLLNAQDPLVRILKDDKAHDDVKITIIKAFGFTKDDRATDVLIHLLDSDSVAIQNAVVEALGELKTRNSIQKITEAMLDSQRTMHTRILLARALGYTNDRDAVEPLIKMLAVGDRGLEDAAKKSLEKITKLTTGNDSAWWDEWWSLNKTKTREQWLEDIVLKQEENEKQLETKITQMKLEVAQNSIKLLESRPDRMDTKPLIEAIKSDYPEVKIFAAKELIKIKDPSVVDVLIHAISDKDEGVRIEIVQALGEIGDERAVKPLVNAMHDESLAVREKAAKALGKLGKREAEGVLISALSSNTDLSVISAVIEALGQIGDTMAVDPLITFMTHKESIIRENTAAALGKLRDSRAVEPLVAALNDQQERVRWYAADSLGKIGNPICVDSLIKLLSDTSARVRESAVTALGQIGNQQAIESLIKALQDSDKRVAEQAAGSLVNIKNMNFDSMDTVSTTFYTNKDYKRAEVILGRQITEYSKQPDMKEKILQARIKLAKTLFALRDWQKALGLYEEVVKQSPADNTTKIELIQCLKETKQYDRALEYYSAWIKESPENNQVYWQGRLDIAKTLAEQEKYEDVQGLINGLKSEDPSLGGELFKSQFQTLREQCAKDKVNSNKIRQHVGHEVTSGGKD